MDRLFEIVWTRYGRWYPWAICALIYPPGLGGYLSFALIIVGFEGSGRYVEAVLVIVVAMFARVYVLVLPFSTEMRLIQAWAAGRETDPMKALRASYAQARKAIPRTVATDIVWTGLLGIVVAYALW